MNEKNSEKTLLIVGHSVVDTIYDPRRIEPLVRWGGIHNVARSFGNKVIVEPAAFGEAKIILDIDKSHKEVYADINQVSRTIKSLPKADWMHISYQNKLDAWQPFSDFEGIISTDWCRGDSASLPKNTSFAFIASDEFNACAESVWNEEAVFIAHCPESVSMWQNGLLLNKFDIKPLGGINPLGAGDHFAACFIASKLNNGSNIEAVEFAIQNTRQWLLSQ